MELKHKLLDHPFYQAWTMGDITMDQLSVYHKSYADFIELMPVYWNKINEAFGAKGDLAEKIVNEEFEHIALWHKWSDRLPVANEYPKMSDIIEALDGMTPSELLGAVQAFEIQQPGVAETKKDGLLKHYGFTNEETVYFDEHMEEEHHINYGNKIREMAVEAEYRAGFDKGAELFYNGLNKFMN